MVSIKKEYDVKDYTYDGIYDMNSTQDEVFEKSAKPVIDVSFKY
jgi:DNA polymerase II large subunit